MIYAPEQIANLITQLEQAAMKEATYLSKITGLRNELADMYTALKKQEHMLEDYGMLISQYNSELTTAQLDSPSSSQHTLLCMTLKSSKEKQRVKANLASPTPVTLLKFLKLNISQSLYPVYSSSPGWTGSDIHNASDPSPSDYHFPKTPHTSTKPNQEQAMSSLGSTTVAFISHHNLMHFAQFLTLIVQNHSPTRWSTMLGALSLSDDLRSGILGALTTDLEAGAFKN